MQLVEFSGGSEESKLVRDLEGIAIRFSIHRLKKFHKRPKIVVVLAIKKINKYLTFNSKSYSLKVRFKLCKPKVISMKMPSDTYLSRFRCCIINRFAMDRAAIIKLKV